MATEPTRSKPTGCAARAKGGDGVSGFVAPGSPIHTMNGLVFGRVNAFCSQQNIGRLMQK